METSVLLLFSLGLSVGAFGTLVGVGGGIILVPIFLLGFQWGPQQAIGTSLAIVFLNAISGSIAYVRQKKVFYDAAVRFSIATLPGAVIGSYAAKYFTNTGFRTAFGVLLIMIAMLMLLRTKPQMVESGFDKEKFTYNKVLGVVISALVGFLSSILGIGGGVIHVPAMVYLLSFPAHIATATSHFVLAISSFFGVVSHLFLGNILLKPAVAIGAGAVVGAQIGARLSMKVKSVIILRLLAIALIGLGIRLVLAIS